MLTSTLTRIHNAFLFISTSTMIDARMFISLIRKLCLMKIANIEPEFWEWQYWPFTLRHRHLHEKILIVQGNYIVGEFRYCFSASVDRDKCDKLNLSLTSIQIFVRFLFYFTISQVKSPQKDWFQRSPSSREARCMLSERGLLGLWLAGWWWLRLGMRPGSPCK